MSRGNGYGNHRTTRAQAMAAHDRASPVVRWIGNYAVAKWASDGLEEIVQELMFEHELPRDAALKRLARTVARIDAQDTIKDYGPGHPEARA